MADLLEEASAWLDGQRTRFLSRPVEYRRGQDHAAVSAAVGRSSFEVIDDTGAAISLESRDFIVPAAELVFGGAQI